MTVRSFGANDKFRNVVNGKFDLDTGLLTKITSVNGHAVEYDLTGMGMKSADIYGGGVNWAEETGVTTNTFKGPLLMGSAEQTKEFLDAMSTPEGVDQFISGENVIDGLDGDFVDGLKDQVQSYFESESNMVSDEFLNELENQQQTAGFPVWLWFLPISLILGKVLKIY